MLFNCPLGVNKADRLIELLDLPAAARILDVGCGQGEFLIRLIEKTGSSGLGIDMDKASIAVARESATHRLPAGSWELRQCDMQSQTLQVASFDLAICIGSTHAFGLGEAAYAGAFDTLGPALRDGGYLLVGEGYWKQTPPPDYLQLIGEPVGIYLDHAGNISFAVERGFIPLYATVSNEDEWDHFEWSHRMKIEREAARQPDDTILAQKREHSRVWRDGYLRWGRATMGFGFYLFQKPFTDSISAG